MVAHLRLAREGLAEVRVRAVEPGDAVFGQCVAMATLAGFTQFHEAIARRPARFFVLEEAPPGEAFAVAAAVGAWAPGELDAARHLDASPLAEARRLLGHEVAADALVELGAVVAGLPGRAARLLRIVPALLLAEGAELALCLASGRLQRLIDAAELPFEGVAAARAEAVPGPELPLWGRFFESRPMVGWIPLAAAVDRAAAWLEAHIVEVESAPAASPDRRDGSRTETPRA